MCFWNTDAFGGNKINFDRTPGHVQPVTSELSIGYGIFQSMVGAVVV